MEGNLDFKFQRSKTSFWKRLKQCKENIREKKYLQWEFTSPFFGPTIKAVLSAVMIGGSHVFYLESWIVQALFLQGVRGGQEMLKRLRYHLHQSLNPLHAFDDVDCNLSFVRVRWSTVNKRLQWHKGCPCNRDGGRGRVARAGPLATVDRHCPPWKGDSGCKFFFSWKASIFSPSIVCHSVLQRSHVRNKEGWGTDWQVYVIY